MTLSKFAAMAGNIIRDHIPGAADPSVVLDDRDQERLSRKQIERLARQLPTNIVANPLTVAAFLAVFWGQVATPLLLAWAVYSQFAIGLALALVIRHARARERWTSADWKRGFTAFALADAVTWAIVPWLFFDPARPLYTLFAGAVLLGIGTGAQFSYFSYVRVAYVISLAALLSMSLRFAVIGGTMYFVLALMVILLVGLVLIIGRGLSRALLESWCLQFQLERSENELREKYARRAAELRQSEARVADAQRIAALGSYEWDPRSNDLTWSVETYRIMARAAADFRPSLEGFLGCVHPDDRAFVKKMIDEALEEKRSYETEFRVVHPGGEVRIVHDRGEVVLGIDGEIAQLRGAVHDITERKQSEQELQESEYRFRAVLESAPDAMIVVEEDGRICLANSRIRDLFGYDPSELMDRDVEVLIPDRFRAAHDRKRADFTLVGGARRMGERDQIRGRTKAGVEIPIEISLSTIDAPEGRLVIAAIRDISDRVKADEELRQSESRFRALLGHPNLGILVRSRETILYCNQAFAEIYGYEDPDAILALPSVTSLESDNDRPRIQAMREARQAGQEVPDRYEFQGLRKDGSSVWLENRVHQITWDNEVVFLTATIDITDRKRAEAARKESEDRYRRLSDLSPVGIFRTDAKGNCIYVNERWQVFSGLTAEQARGQGWIEALHPDDREKIFEQWYRSAETDDLFQAEYRFLKPDGQIVWLYGQSSAERDADNNITGYIGALTDITERKHAEEQLAQAQRMEAVGQLTAGVAHDFNNMLAVILGNAELLEDEFGANNPRLTAMSRGATRAANLTQRLLAFSRKQVLQPEIIDTNKLIADITDLLRRTLEEHIDIETVTGTGLWTCEVDPAQLENAVVNLALNARDAMPDGGKLTIETANTKLDDDYAAAQAEVTPGQYVMLAVTDTGFGMPPEVQDHVFEPFYTTKAVGAGSGLGLSMVHGFVKQSGGHVTIYSELGEGTTIKLYLPRSAETEAVERKPVSVEVPVARGETVLVVEDDPEVRTLAVALLSSLGYQIMEAATGAAALEQLGTMTKVNLLLTDVVLPGGMNGRELAAEVEQRSPGIPVLYMSGYTEDAITHHGRLEAGAELLQKPFRKADLARAVRKALDGLSV